MGVDLRTGRYERKFAHTDCVNGVVAVGEHYLVSAGDDKLVRVADVRRMIGTGATAGGGSADTALANHRTRSVVFCLAADEEAIYAGCDHGDVRVFDYSAEANPSAEQDGVSGGFTGQQKAALAAALSNAQRVRPGRIRPG